MIRASPPSRMRRCWTRRDEGQASVLLIMLVPVLLLVFALVWEAGQMLAAKTELLSVAHSAARAGAQQLDEPASLATGVPVLDADRASRSVIDHLGSVCRSGQVFIEGNRVVVLARTSYTPALLPIGPRTIEAEATARALEPTPR